MIYDDIRQDKSVIFIDPHGDDCRDILDAIPPHRTNHVSYLDVADLAHPIAFNPLAAAVATHATNLAASLTDGFKDIWHEAWSERMAWFLSMGLALLIEKNRTLLELRPLYFNKSGILETSRPAWVSRHYAPRLRPRLHNRTRHQASDGRLEACRLQPHLQ